MVSRSVGFAPSFLDRKIIPRKETGGGRKRISYFHYPLVFSLFAFWVPILQSYGGSEK